MSEMEWKYKSDEEMCQIRANTFIYNQNGFHQVLVDFCVPVFREHNTASNVLHCVTSVGPPAQSNAD